MQDFLAPVKGIVSNFIPWMVCLAIQAKAAASTQSGSIPRLDVVSNEIVSKFAFRFFIKSLLCAPPPQI